MSAQLAAEALAAAAAADTSRPGMDSMQSHSSGSSNGQGQHGASTSAPTGGASAQSGPPYLCPTCQTSYSRLEYLRRHERRHADIRPFVCDCGKGFSRSDVLSRHKRQCAVHLSGGAADTSTGKASAAASGNGAGAATGKKGAGTKRKASGSGAGTRPRKSSNKSGSKEEDDEADENSNGNSMDASGYDKQQQQQYMGGYPQQQQRGGVIMPPQPYQHQMPMGSVQQQGSFPFPLQPGMSQGGPGSAPLMPPAPYGGEGGGMASHGNHMGGAQGGNQAGQQGNAGANNGASNIMAHHLSAINSFVNQHNNYPPSPESTGTLSQHGSPRFMARDMSRHNSGSSRFSLRKSGGSFDHIGPRQSNTGQSQQQQQQQQQPQQQYSADFWNALDPAAKTATTGTEADYVSATTGASYPPLSLADGAGSGGLSTTPGITGLTTPRGDLQRFAVSAGPLSPFSSIALNSTMSPYLSAFSNARDTPFVASPSRGAIPGTPGSSLNVFDWTMRPPSKPASSSQKRDSVGNSAQAGASTGGVTSSPSGGKRKVEGEEGGRKSPRIQEKTEADLDADQRSAAELLDSLRNSGPRTQPSASAETTAADAAGSSAPTEQGADAGAAPNTGPSDSSGQSFFEQRNANAGPDAFRLNLQHSSAPPQQNNGALAGVHGSSPHSSFPNLAGFQNGTAASSAAMAPTVSSNSLDVPQKTWDAILNSEGWFTGTPKPSSGMSAELASLGDVFPSSGTTPLSAGALEASTKWLMSPGVQQIINSFAPQPGDFGSYFSGATTAAGANTGSSTLPPLGITSASAKPNGGASTIKSATPSILTSSQALERALADPKNPFYVSPDLFRACYSVPHWDLPPATRLSMLALYAQQNLVKHMPVIHEPTFRLDTTPGCIAFALCMLGCHEHGRQWWTGAEVSSREEASDRTQNGQNGTSEPFRGEQGTQLTRSRYDEEDGQILVRPNVMEEKADMLIKSFPSRTTSAKDRVSVVQVLLLFQAARMISHDEMTRSNAANVHPTMISLARQANIFDVQAETSARHVRFTPEDEMRSTLTSNGTSANGSTSNGNASEDDEKLWRRWTELAGRRRTAFGIFVMDTVLHLDASASQQLQPVELEHLPLPSPDTIWRAPNVDAWKQALAKYQGPRFGDAMRELLSGSSPAALSGRHGSFARLALIVALLRGVTHLVESQGSNDVKPSPLQAFVSASSPNPSELGAILQKALQSWRECWDQDDLCLGASGPQGREKLEQVQANDKDMSVLGAHHLFASQTACSATALADDALPFYWVARVILETRCGVESQSSASAVSHLVSEAQYKHGYCANGGNDGSPLAASDFRALLRAAKDFVMADERV